MAEEQGLAAVRLVYTIDRSILPPLNYPDLTLRLEIDPAGIQAITDENGSSLPYSAAPGGTPAVLVTTSSGQITVDWVGEINSGESVGDFAIAPLWEDKRWAWSHGLDDNVYLEEQIALFEAKNWAATLYLITKNIHDTRDEGWIVDVPDINRLLPLGWSIGNHTAGHPCYLPQEVMAGGVQTGQTRLESIVAASPRPDYIITAFAAPCFDGTYQQIIADLQAAGESTLLFNESGGSGLIHVDPGAGELFTRDGLSARPWRPGEPIGRTYFVDMGQPAEMIAHFDWMAARGAEGGHFWLNTLSHGRGEETLEPVIDYLYDTYGPAGSDEVWVAPSEAIVSYLLVRDNSVVTKEQVPIEPPGRSVDGLVAYSGSLTATHHIRIGLHPDENGLPTGGEISIASPGGPYLIPNVADGRFFVSAYLDRDGSGGLPDPDEPRGWYDPDGDGAPDPIVVNGGDVGGVDIALVDPNRPPVISTLSPISSTAVTMSENGQPIPFDLTLGGFDADGDPLTWSIAAQGAHGTAAVESAGTVTATFAYTPATGYTGTDSFMVRLDDGNDSAATTVTVTVEPAAVPPAANFADQTAAGGETVILDGTSSRDGDGNEPAGFRWEQLGGPPVVFDPHFGRTGFIAPAGPVTLTFRLTVNDTAGLAGSHVGTVWVVDGEAAVGVLTATTTFFTPPGAPFTVQIPAGAAPVPFTLVYDGGISAGPPAGRLFVSEPFHLSAHGEGRPLPGLTFDRPLTITLDYGHIDLGGIDPATLTLYFWEEDRWEGSGSPPVSHDPSASRLVFTVSRLTTFAFAVEEKFQLYLPLLGR